MLWLPKQVGDFVFQLAVTIGTANFGILESRFPQGVIAISQVLWGRCIHFGNFN